MLSCSPVSYWGSVQMEFLELVEFITFFLCGLPQGILFPVPWDTLIIASQNRKSTNENCKNPYILCGFPGKTKGYKTAILQRLKGGYFEPDGALKINAFLDVVNLHTTQKIPSYPTTIPKIPSPPVKTRHPRLLPLTNPTPKSPTPLPKTTSTSYKRFYKTRICNRQMPVPHPKGSA